MDNQIYSIYIYVDNQKREKKLQTLTELFTLTMVSSPTDGFTVITLHKVTLITPLTSGGTTGTLKHQIK